MDLIPLKSPPFQNPKGEKSSSLQALLFTPTSWVGLSKGDKASRQWRVYSGRAGMHLHDDTTFLLFQAETSSPIQSESSKVHHDLFSLGAGDITLLMSSCPPFCFQKKTTTLLLFSFLVVLLLGFLIVCALKKTYGRVWQCSQWSLERLALECLVSL